MQIPNTEPGARLDSFLATALQQPRDTIQTKLKEGCFLINNKPAKASYRLRENDLITQVAVINEPQATEPITHSLKGLSFLYEDRDILVINKPVGWVVHPGEQTQGDTLVERLKAFGFILAPSQEPGREGLVHRLDRFTEGIMVLAKTPEAQAHLSQQFQDKTILKKYAAMVKGNVFHDHSKLDYPIARHPSQRTKFTVVPTSFPGIKRDAVSFLQVLKRYQTKTLVEVIPQTGRTHQIRVHLNYIGHPVLGDQLYYNHKGEGQKLQAYYLAFTHPKTLDRMAFQLPLSKRLFE